MNYTPSPHSLGILAERMAKQQGLAFAVVTGLCLGLVMLNTWQNILNQRQASDRCR
jgi:hypothetical protein